MGQVMVRYRVKPERVAERCDEPPVTTAFEQVGAFRP